MNYFAVNIYLLYVQWEKNDIFISLAPSDRYYAKKKENKYFVRIIASLDVRLETGDRNVNYFSPERKNRKKNVKMSKHKKEKNLKTSVMSESNSNGFRIMRL
jgi:hypothetical protein